jgi:hypothetical protein
MSLGRLIEPPDACSVSQERLLPIWSIEGDKEAARKIRQEEDMAYEVPFLAESRVVRGE